MISQLAATRIKLNPITKGWEETIMVFGKEHNPLRLHCAVIVWIRSDSSQNWLEMVKNN